MSFIIAESSNCNEDFSSLILLYHYPQIKKKLIGAQCFINIFDLIIENLFLIFVDCHKRI